jgi:hypothetical protein
MQLRVARLCLDCEELHVEDRCPVCASEQYAFLSAWLPSEERRRWRRPSSRRSAIARHPARQAVRAVAAWFGIEIEDRRDVRTGLRTRASDHVPDLNFDAPAAVPKPAPAQQAAAEPLAQTHKR